MTSNNLLVALPFILLFIALRLWRGSRARKLKVERMWIRPIFILLILATTIAAQPPPMEGLVLIELGIAAAAGFAFGWWRGRMVRISIHPETHELSSQQSPWSLLIFIAIMAARFGIRFALAGEQSVGGAPVAVIADAITIFYGGNIVGMQWEQWRRAQKLLTDAVAAKAAGKMVPNELTQAHAGDKAEAGGG